MIVHVDIRINHIIYIVFVINTFILIYELNIIQSL